MYENNGYRLMRPIEFLTEKPVQQSCCKRAAEYEAEIVLLKKELGIVKTEKLAALRVIQEARSILKLKDWDVLLPALRAMKSKYDEFVAGKDGRTV